MKKPPKLTQPLKWHGGKNYLAPKIVALMPPRCKNPNDPAPKDRGWLHYVEPYAGGLAVLLANDPEGISEVVNDINGELTNFWRVLQGQTSFNQFCRLVQAVPPSEVEFAEACKNAILDADGYGESVHRAVTFFVRCRQSRQALGRDFSTLAKVRTRRGMNEFPSAWLNAIGGLPAIHARFKRVVILNRKALYVIRQQDGPRTLFYLDPPYMHQTRATTDGWKRRDFNLPNNAAGGAKKRRMTECVWCNF